MKKIIILLLLLFCISSVSASLTDGLITYYELEEDAANTDVLDSHGSNDGTASTNTNNLNTIGKINDAFDFTKANNEYVDSGIKPDPTEGFTINIWFQTSDTDGNEAHMVSTWGGGGAGEASYKFAHSRTGETDGTITYETYDGSSSYKVTTSGTYNDGNWHMATFVFDGSGGSERLIGYINGAKVNNISASIQKSTSYELNIGQRGLEGGAYYDGKIDEVYISNRSLSSTEVSSLYNSGNGLAYPFVVDTCSCPGAGNDWEIDMSDYCNITSDCDLTTGKLSFTGSGETKINAIIHTTDLGDPGTNGILKILSDCLIWDI